MKRNILIVFGLLFGFFTLAGAQSSVQAQSADQVYERLQTKYKGIQSVRAEFSQTMTSEFSDEKMTSDGVVLMQGNKYRVETQAQTLVTDGKVTWVYLPADRQVLVNDYVQDETNFSLNDFLFDYADRYRVASVTTAQLGGEKHFVIRLEPRSGDAFFSDVVLSMRDRDALVTRLQVEDVNGTKMDFTLKNIQVNPKLEANAFTFTPPRNVEIVDLRS